MRSPTALEAERVSGDERVTMRNEQPRDAQAIRGVIELAFGQVDEGDLVDALRRAGALTVSLVAEIEDQVVGHIAFSPVTIRTPHASRGALGLAPLAVLPDHQRRGIGSELVRRGLEASRSAGHRIVVVVGQPEYYQRFGFSRADRHGLECSIHVPAEAFLVAELAPGALSGCSGIADYRPEFGAVST